jgi:myosin-crossreactive antigen
MSDRYIPAHDYADYRDAGQKMSDEINEANRRAPALSKELQSEIAAAKREATENPTHQYKHNPEAAAFWRATIAAGEAMKAHTVERLTARQQEDQKTQERQQRGMQP